MEEFIKIAISEIQIKERIRKDYGDITGLAKSIEQVGLLHPIVITPDYLLIAGERRIMAVKKLGWKDITAQVITAKDREIQLLCEIAENEQSKSFTASERVAYGEEFAQIERLKAKERQGIYLKKGTTSPFGSVEINGEKGKTIDIVAKKVGMSGSQYFRAKKVVESGNQEVIDKMDSGEIGILTAYEKVKIPKEGKPVKIMPDKQEEQNIVVAKVQRASKLFACEINGASFMHTEIRNMTDNEKKDALKALELAQKWLTILKNKLEGVV